MTQLEALTEALKALRADVKAQRETLESFRMAMLAMAQAGAALEERVGNLEHSRPRIVIPGGE